MSDQTPKSKRARIVAPKVEQGPEFQLIREYWFTTFRELNPFDGGVSCRKCSMPTVWERYIGELYGGAVTVHEFACAAGHVWKMEKTHD